MALTTPELTIKHIASGHKITFKTYKLLDFAESYDTSWNSESVFGRMDPIVTYQGTQRTINLSIRLGDATQAEMKDYLKACDALAKFQYPIYESSDNSLSLARPPLLEVSLANYIRSSTGGPLTCVMNGYKFDPSDGVTLKTAPRVVKMTQEAGGDTVLLPMSVLLSFNLIVLHSQTPGYLLDKKGKASFNDPGGYWGKRYKNPSPAAAPAAGNTGDEGELTDQQRADNPVAVENE